MSIDAESVFREEADELLADMEQVLLELEGDPASVPNISKLFRDIHTLKGSGAMFGFSELARFAHEVETVFDRVRSGDVSLDPALITLALQAKDHIQSLLRADLQDGEAARSESLIAGFRAYLGQDEAPREAAPTPADAPVAASADRVGHVPGAAARTYLIRYRPAPDSFMSGTDPLGLVAELETLGRVHSVFRSAEVPPLEDIDPEKAYGSWDLLLVGEAELGAVKDVFIFVEDDHGVEIAEIHCEPIRDSDVRALLGLIEAGADKSHEALRGELAAWVSAQVGRRAARPGEPGVGSAGGAWGEDGKEASAASIRVDSGRLDALVTLVGELVIAQSRLQQAVANSGDEGIYQAISEDMGRLVAELRDQALGIRMIPIGSIYGMLRRLVRDLCGSMGKSAAFVGLGAQTELDKNVIDQLKDPLVHILRNCIDHGIEPPAAREAAGKPAQGSVTLDARHSGGSIVITISDDGAGIDTARVRAKAVEKGLLSPSDNPGEKELLGLIFAPGFSTAAKVSSVSGRGVGMDVVKKNVESLRGSVEVESAPGRGSTFRIRMPLTLAIIDGLQVRVGEESYVLPLAAVEACQERFLDREPRDLGVIEHRGGLIPCLSLRQLLRVAGEHARYERVIVAKVDDGLVGLAVDAAVGQQQTVIKPLDDMFKGVPFIAGTTVNGDGVFSVILDVPSLAQFAAEQTERKAGG